MIQVNYEENGSGNWENKTQQKWLQRVGYYRGWVAVISLSSFKASGSRGYTLVSSIYCYSIFCDMNSESKQQKNKK